MNSRETVETLADLQQKQRVRFTLTDGTTVEARVDQLEYDLEDRLRLELDVRDDPDRYQVNATFADGEWSEVTMRTVRSDGGDGADGEWESLGVVRSAVPLERP